MNVSARSTGAWQHTLDIDVPIEEVEQKLAATDEGRAALKRLGGPLDENAQKVFQKVAAR